MTIVYHIVRNFSIAFLKCLEKFFSQSVLYFRLHREFIQRECHSRWRGFKTSWEETGCLCQKIIAIEFWNL